MTIDYKALAAKAAEVIDHTETTSGGDFEQRLIPDGLTIGRFVEYIELGVQPQRPYEGKPRPDIAQARFTFELLHSKNKYEREIDGKTVEFYDRFSFVETIKLGEKARFKKLFNTMRYGRDNITHFAQMLNEPFLLNFTHNEGEKDGKKKTYVNLYNAGVYGIQPPVVVDPITQVTSPVPVPAATVPIKIFLWDLPSKETWDSLHIAGTRTVKDGKSERQVSKNWLQELILSAKNFSDSPLEDLLTGSEELTKAVSKPAVKSAPVAASPAPAESVTVPAVAKAASPASTKEAVKTKSKTKAAKPVAAPAETVDPLKALGLGNG